MTEAEHTEHLGTPMLEIAFAHVTNMRGSMKSETIYHALYDHFLRDIFGVVWGGVRGITLPLVVLL